MAEVSFELPSKGEGRGVAADAKIKNALAKLKETVNGKIGQANFEANAALAGKWYEPKVIATEQSITSTSYVAMGTADEITGVIIPANGLLVVSYDAQVKSSASEGTAALFVGSNEVLALPGGSLIPSSFARIFTTVESKLGRELATPVVSTGKVTPSAEIGQLAAGTYTVSIRFKAPSGSVTAKERVLRARVVGS